MTNHDHHNPVLVTASGKTERKTDAKIKDAATHGQYSIFVQHDAWVFGDPTVLFQYHE